MRDGLKLSLTYLISAILIVSTMDRITKPDAQAPGFTNNRLFGVSVSGPLAGPRSPPASIEGYVVRVDATGAVLGPGTSVAPGDRIGLALSAPAGIDWSPAIRDSSGTAVAKLAAFHVGSHIAQSATPWIDGDGYPVATIWDVPKNLASGVYFVGDLPQLFFVVRQSAEADAPVVVLLPTNTLNAYTNTDGHSLYKAPIAVTSVTFLRPQQNAGVRQWLAFLRWTGERHPFNVPVAFASDFDMDDAALLEHAKVLIVLGHSEYWTRQARMNFDAFVRRGGDAIMAGGNDMWWQTRYSPDHRIMYEYRDKSDLPADQGGDPESNPLLKTKLWIDQTLKFPIIRSVGGDFRHAGYGQRGRRNGLFSSHFTLAEAASPLFAGTGLKTCDAIALPLSTEYDGAPITGLDSIGRPVPDLAEIHAFRFELLAYEWNHDSAYKLGTMHIMQRTLKSGYVLHMGARECCMTEAFYKDNANGSLAIQAVLKNAVRLFLSDADPMPDAHPNRPAVFAMRTPWKSDLPDVPPGPCAPQPSGMATSASMVHALTGPEETPGN